MAKNILQLQMKVKMKNIVVGALFVCAAIVVIICVIIWVQKNTQNKKESITHTSSMPVINHSISKKIDYDNPALYHATKSVDGEHQFTESTQWKSQPSKCFDCESQLKAQCGDACVYNGTKQKLF